MTDVPFYLIASIVVLIAFSLITGVVLFLYSLFRIKLTAFTTVAAMTIALFVLFFDEMYIRVSFSDFCNRNVGVRITDEAKIDSLELRGNFPIVSFGALIGHVDYVDFAPSKVRINRNIKRALRGSAYRLSKFSQFGEECSFFRRILRLHPTEDVSRLERLYFESNPHGGCIGLIEIDRPNANYYALSEENVVDGRILYRKIYKSGIAINHSVNDERVASVQKFSIRRGFFFSIGPTFFKDTLKCDTSYFTYGIVGLADLLDEI